MRRRGSDGLDAGRATAFVAGDGTSLHAALRRELCARCNVDTAEYVRQEESVFMPYLQDLLSSSKGMRYTYQHTYSSDAAAAAAAAVGASPLLGAAAQARAAESQPWTPAAVQGLVSPLHLVENTMQLDRHYEIRLRRGSGDFDGRTLVDDRHRGAGTPQRGFGPPVRAHVVALGT